MGMMSSAAGGSSVGKALGGASGATTGAYIGATLGLIGGVMDYLDAQKQADFNRELLGKKKGALDREFEASNKLLETKYSLKRSGLKSKKVDLNDEIMTEMDGANIKAKQETATLLAHSVGSGATGNIRARLVSSTKQMAELTKTNSYMQGKRMEGQLIEAGATAHADKIATQEFKEIQYKSQRDLMQFERDNIQDPNALSIFL